MKEREKRKKRERWEGLLFHYLSPLALPYQLVLLFGIKYWCVCVCVCVYIYIYIMLWPVLLSSCKLCSLVAGNYEQEQKMTPVNGVVTQCPVLSKNLPPFIISALRAFLFCQLQISTTCIVEIYIFFL